MFRYKSFRWRPLLLICQSEIACHVFTSGLYAAMVLYLLVTDFCKIAARLSSNLTTFAYRSLFVERCFPLVQTLGTPWKLYEKFPSVDTLAFWNAFSQQTEA